MDTNYIPFSDNDLPNTINLIGNKDDFNFDTPSDSINSSVDTISSVSSNSQSDTQYQANINEDVVIEQQHSYNYTIA